MTAKGPVLGPVPFDIFINDVDKDIGNKVIKFTDHTKLGRVS